MSIARLTKIAQQQHGVFTRDQAREAGVTKGLLRQRISQGALDRAFGVYVVRGSVDTWLRRISIASLSVEGAAVSHGSAARLWRLIDREPHGIEVSAVRWRRQHRDFIVHESQDLSPQDIQKAEGIRVTTPERTVVDLGANARWLVEPALETALRKGLVAIADVQRFVDRVARRGRRGVGVVRPILERRIRWDQFTESELEAAFLRVLDQAHLELPDSQFVVRDQSGAFVCRADFAYPELRLLIELDSEAHHMDRLTFRRDRAKQNMTELLGWSTLRYTWWDLVEQPGKVRRQVRTALASSGVVA